MIARQGGSQKKEKLKEDQGSKETIGSQPIQQVPLKDLRQAEYYRRIALKWFGQNTRVHSQRHRQSEDMPGRNLRLSRIYSLAFSTTPGCLAGFSDFQSIQRPTASTKLST